MQRTSSTPVLLGRLREWSNHSSAGAGKKPEKRSARQQPSCGPSDFDFAVQRRPSNLQLPAIHPFSQAAARAGPGAGAREVRVAAEPEQTPRAVSKSTLSRTLSTSDVQDKSTQDVLGAMAPPAFAGLRRSRTQEVAASDLPDMLIAMAPPVFTGLRRSRTDETSTSRSGSKSGQPSTRRSSTDDLTRLATRDLRHLRNLSSHSAVSSTGEAGEQTTPHHAWGTPSNAAAALKRRSTRRILTMATMASESEEFSASVESGEGSSPCTTEQSSSPHSPPSSRLAHRGPARQQTQRRLALGSRGYSGETGSSTELGWTVGERLGQGSYGSVHKAMDANRGFIFAVKKGIIDDRDEEGRKYKDTLEEELSICKHLRHPNIVSYLGYAYVDGCLHICLEYVPGGSIATMLQEFGTLDRPLVQKAARGLTEGLDYLHTRKPPIVHRDIKGANALVDLNFCVKLADFGCSKRCDCTKSFTTIGSIPWMAPEVINQQDGHGRKADIWSLGCTLIEMASGEKPWGNELFSKNVVYALSHIGTSPNVPSIPDAMSRAGQDLVRRCVRRDAADRPGTAELLAHDFLAAAASGA
mmetsp:Transcript_33066/g.87416  ORF Transcript_33066/g.87416 Transcript_33066/m.87416 type:complete len:583 (-) Transcript_33066:38-1786(-)